MNRLTVTLLAILAMSPLGGRLGAADSEEFLVEDLGVLGAPVDSTVSSDKSRSEAFSINSRGYIAGESTIPVEVAAFTHGVAWAIPVFRGVSADGSGSGMVRAVGNYGIIASSTTAGQTWAPSGWAPGQDRRLQALVGTMDSSTDPLLTVGSRAGIFRNSSTAPQAIDWLQRPLRDELTPSLRSVDQIYDDQAGSVTFNAAWAVAVGDEGTILTSLDFGLTWQQEACPSGFEPRSVAVVSPEIAIAVGSNGTILVRNRGAQNLDPDGDGSPWNRVPSGTTTNLTAISAGRNHDGSNALVVIAGQDGSLRELSYPAELPLTDANNNAIPDVFEAWTVVLPASERAFWAVAVNGQGPAATAVAVGQMGKIAYRDGATWTQESAPVVSTWLGVAMTGPQDAVAVGPAGRAIIRSTTGWLAAGVVTSPVTIDLQILAGRQSTAHGINSAGQIVGSGHLNANQVKTALTFQPLAAIRFNDLTDPLHPYKQSALAAINEEGISVGTVTNQNPTDPLQDGVSRAILVTPGEAPLVLETLGGDQSRGNAISNRKERFKTRHVQTEELVGAAANPQGVDRAFLYRPQHFNALARVNEDTNTNQGQVDTLKYALNPYPHSVWNWNLIRHGTPAEVLVDTWYVGASGGIYFSGQDSAPMAKQVSGTDRDLFGVDFYDFDNGVVVGEGGTILWTANGGITWTPGTDSRGQPVTTRDLYDVHIVKGGPAQTEQVGFNSVSTSLANVIVFACGAGGTILKSNDLGRTWRIQPTGTTSDLFAISFPGDGYIPWRTNRDAVRGWAVGDQVAVVTRSSGEPTDGQSGVSVPGWSVVSLPSNYTKKVFWCVDAYRPDCVFLGGEGGIVLRGAADPNAPQGWQFYQINAGDIGTQDVFDLKAVVNNYVYNDGAAVQSFSQRSLAAPVASTIAPNPGDWNQWLTAYPEGAIVPIIIFGTAEGGFYSSTPWDQTIRGGLLGANMDLRGVHMSTYHIMADNQDPDSRREPQVMVVRDPEPILLETYYISYSGALAATDGRVFTGTWGNDPDGRARGGDSLAADIYSFPNEGTHPPEDGIDIYGLLPGVGGNNRLFWFAKFGQLDRKQGQVRDLGSLAGAAGSSEGFDIDDSGNVTGVSRAGGSDVGTAFILRKKGGAWNYDPMIGLGTLGGRSSQGNAISRILGQVVGTSTIYVDRPAATSVEQPRAFMWSGAQIRDLNSMISATPAGSAGPGRWVLTSANDINEYGEIAGIGYVDVDGNGLRGPREPLRAVVLHPVGGLTNQAPSVRIIHPSGGEAFASPTVAGGKLIRIGALARDLDGTINRVEFYIGAALIGTSSVSAASGGGGATGYFETTWSVPTGITVPESRVITAVAVDDLGRRGTAVPVSITVAPNGQRLVIEELGTLGGDESEAYSVNNRGEVVGRSRQPDNSWRAFIWSQIDGMKALPILDNRREGSLARDINDQGLVVGESLDATGAIRAVRWQHGSIGSISGPLSSTSPSRALGTNPLGQIVGGGPASFGTGSSVGWFWRNDAEGSRPLPTLGGLFGEAVAINAYRSITGSAQTIDGEVRAFRWDRGFPLGSLISLKGAQSSRGNAINYQGSVVGRTTFAGGNRGFVWDTAGAPTALPPGVTGVVSSEALGVNDGNFTFRTIVGRTVTSTGSSRAILWSAGIPLDVSSVLPAGSPATLVEELRDINNAGLMVGRAVVAGKGRAVALRLVEPVNGVVNTPPAIEITNPLQDQIFSTTGSLILNAIAADGDGTVTKVDFWLSGSETNDNLLIGSVITGTVIQGVTYYTFPWTTVQAGAYSIVAVATDDLGSTSISAPVRVEVRRPQNNSAPVVSVTRIGSATVGGTATVKVADPGRLTIRGSAQDSDGLAKVELYLTTGEGEATTPVATILNPLNGTWTVTLPDPLAVGVYTMVAVATERVSSTSIAEALSSVSAPVVFYYNTSTVDPIPAPQVTITAPADGSSVNAGGILELRAGVISGEIESVVFYVGTESSNPALITNAVDIYPADNYPGFRKIGSDDSSLGGFIYEWVSPEPGYYVLYAVGVDAAGRRGISTPRRLTVNPSRMRIDSEPYGAAGNGPVVARIGSSWSYQFSVAIVNPDVKERLRLEIQDLDPADGVDVTGLIAVFPNNSVDSPTLIREIRWSTVTAPTTGDHVRFRIRARLENSDGNADNDPVDIQDVLLRLVPAPTGFGG